MLATEQFRLVMRPDVKQKLAILAERDGRSKAKTIERLILEKFEAVQSEAIGEKTARPVQASKELESN